MRPSLRRLAPALFAVGLTALFAGGCGGGVSDLTGATYAESAQENYTKGMKALQDEDYDAAARYFRYVKAKFPFSKYSVLSDLRLADSQFMHEDFIEAIDSYTQFEKFHPTHEYVTNGYCAYKIGESYYKQIPDDWWLVPPSYEKDQTAALDANRQLQDFLDRYPESEYVPKARDLAKKVHELLAAHEMYVARFYETKHQYRGVAFRLETLLARFPETSYAPSAYLELGEAYLQLGEPWNARLAFQGLITRHPKDGSAAQAKDYLAQLDKKFGPGGPPVPAHPIAPRLQPSTRPTYAPPPKPEEEGSGE